VGRIRPIAAECACGKAAPFPAVPRRAVETRAVLHETDFRAPVTSSRAARGRFSGNGTRHTSLWRDRQSTYESRFVIDR
jgi:hypothetical protein